MFAGCIHPVFALAAFSECSRYVRTRIRRIRRPRSTWAREWLSEDRTQQLGHYSTFLTRELRTEDVNAFHNHLRMPRELFDEILERVTSCSHRETRHEVPLYPTTWTEAVSDSKTSGHWRQLLITLLCVSMQCKAAICHMVPELCRAIMKAYKDEVFAVHVTPGEWRALVQEFEVKWNVCLMRLWTGSILSSASHPTQAHCITTTRGFQQD